MSDSAALSIARRAVNGWACYAKREIEHNEIATLHQEISKLAAALDAAPSPERLNADELLPRGYLTIQQAQGVKHPFRAHAFNANVCGECLLNPEAIQHRAGLPTESLDRIAAFCEQTAKDGIRPSLAWFGETAEALRVAAALARSAPAEKLEGEKNDDDPTRVDGVPSDRPLGSTASSIEAK